MNPNIQEYFQKYFDLYMKANFAEEVDDRIQATDELNALKSEIDNRDLVAQLNKFSQEKALDSGVFDEAGQLKYESDKAAYNSAIKGMVDNFATDVLGAVVGGAQAIKGLNDLRELQLPAQPPLPQDTPELSQALSVAQREAEMIDPRLQEARKRAALMALNQAEEISKTASAGQAGAYGANMQQAINRVADTMRQGAFEDQQLRQNAQRLAANLAAQKALEDRFQYGAAERQFQNRYNEFNTQRNDANLLARTGFENLFGSLGGTQQNIDTLQTFMRMRDSLKQPQQTAPTAPQQPSFAAMDTSATPTNATAQVNPQVSAFDSFGLFQQPAPPTPPTQQQPLMQTYEPTDDEVMEAILFGTNPQNYM